MPRPARAKVVGAVTHFKHSANQYAQAAVSKRTDGLFAVPYSLQYCLDCLMPLRSWQTLSVIAALTTLCGCSIERLSGLGGDDQRTETPTQGTAQPKLVAPPVDLAGKWTLASPGAGSCVMTFGSTSGMNEGTIAPAGGCPFSFFTSRKWTSEETGLVIRDHTGQPLVTLTPTDKSLFEGRTAANQTITLRR